MRQNHVPGDKLFVDYAGDKILVVVDLLTGEVRGSAYIRGVLGTSSLSYAEAIWTETLPDWIGANVRAIEAFGGAGAVLAGQCQVRGDQGVPVRLAGQPQLYEDGGAIWQRVAADPAAPPAR